MTTRHKPNSSARPYTNFTSTLTIRRVLKDMGCPLPNSSEWNPFNNPINMDHYERICNEFGISKDTSWVLQGPGNGGLGRMKQRAQGDAQGDDHLAGETWNPSFYVFGHQAYEGSSYRPSIDHITQTLDEAAQNGWTQFIQLTSQTLTRTGLARINQSIRSYCWSILAAQYETRKPILGIDGVAGGAQQRFVELVEDACIERGGIEFAASTGSGTTVRDYRERAADGP
jgi:hypothetical protein